MSISWRYECDINNNTSLIDVIYCSSVQMSIPVAYFFTVLLKDGREYDLTDSNLIDILENAIDFNAILDAKHNWLCLQNQNC
jgi:hypothetical protein